MKGLLPKNLYSNNIYQLGCKKAKYKCKIRKVEGIKNGKLLTSHRSTIYPCYLPVLGEFNRSWSYKTCRCKDKVFVCSIFLLTINH